MLIGIVMPTKNGRLKEHKLWQEKARGAEIDETAHTEKVTDIREDAAREGAKIQNKTCLNRLN